MRLLTSLFALALAYPGQSFAMSVDENLPIETALAQTEPPAAPPQIQKSCEELIADLSGMNIENEELAKLRKQKAAIDKALAESIRTQYHLYGVTEMRSIQIYERVLNLLARGDTRELIPLLRPYFGNVYEQHRILMKVIKEIKTLRAAPASNDSAKRVAELEKKFIEASRVFGENYAPFISINKLLEGVKAGKAPADAPDLNFVKNQEGPRLLLNLTSERARKAAERTLNILKSPTEQQWISTADSRELPHVEEITTMFSHNLHAILAMRQLAQSEQAKQQNIFRQGVQHLANLYLNITDRTFIPERYRKWILRLIGIAYNNLMMERYLDKIQAVVDVSRIRDNNGNLILSTDDQTMELQVQTLRELRATGVGEDMLVTFARLGYHTDSWRNLKRYIEKKAEETKSETSAYTSLAAAFKDAESRKDELGELPFVYDPAVRHEMIFVGTQIAWLVGSEEFVRHYGIPWSHQLMNYLF